MEQRDGGVSVTNLIWQCAEASSCFPLNSCLSDHAWSVSFGTSVVIFPPMRMRKMVQTPNSVMVWKNPTSRRPHFPMASSPMSS